MTEIEIVRETQQLLDERLRIADEERAAFLGLSGPQRALESETWLTRQIAQALAPLIARLEKLENKPVPTVTAKPPKEFISAIGQMVHDEIAALEKKIAKLEQRKYVGVWATGKYHEGNMVTLDGSIFHCNVEETTQRPGTGPDWTLAIKRGQDARSPSHR